MLSHQWIVAIDRVVILLLMFVFGLHSAVIAEQATSNRLICGKVVDSKGNPVPNADVFCSPSAKDRFPVVQDRTGADGTFRLIAPPADEFEYSPDRLWACAAGYSVAVSTIPNSKEGQSTVRLVLAPPGNFQIKVTLPNGKPAKDAIVLVPALGIRTKRRDILTGEFFFPPETLVTRTAAAADDQGIATIPAWKASDVLRVDVVAPSFGRQTCYSRWVIGIRPEQWDVRLLPVGKLRGRVVADGPYPVDGLTLHVKAMSQRQDFSYCVLEYRNSPPTSSFLSSEATVVTDSQGRFEIPVITHGWVKIDIQDGLNKPYQYRGLRPEFRGESEEVVIHLRKAVHVHGRLSLFNSDARPSQFRIGVSHVSDTPPGGNGVRFLANIDDQGEYDFYFHPGECRLHVDARRESELDRLPGWQCVVRGVNYTYSRSTEYWIRTVPRTDTLLDCLDEWPVRIPEGVEDFECPPIELCQVRGRVLGEGGEPIPHATITIHTHCGEQAIADEHGRFRLWLNRKRGYEIEFNAYAHDVMREPSRAWRVVYGLGKAAEHASCVVSWSSTKFPDGVIPDVTLPLRNKEEVAKLKKTWPKVQSLAKRQMEELMQEFQMP